MNYLIRFTQILSAAVFLAGLVFLVRGEPMGGLLVAGGAVGVINGNSLMKNQRWIDANIKDHG